MCVVVLGCWLLLMGLQLGVLRAEEAAATAPAKRVESLTSMQGGFEERLKTASEKKDLEAMEALAKEVEGKYKPEDVDAYTQLMGEITGQLASLSFGNERQYHLAQEWVMRCLEKGDALPLLEEIRLAPRLRMVLPKTPPEEIAQLRRTKAALFLHTWSRMNKAIDRKFDFSVEPQLNILPPLGAGVPSGVGPEAIDDPKLRAEYAAALERNRAYGAIFSFQHQLHQAEEGFVRGLEAFLISEYSTPSADVKELGALLEKAGMDKAMCKKILDGVNTERSKPAPN